MSDFNEDLAEIQDLNLTYLLIAQRLLKADYTMALMRLKIDDAMGSLLLSLSTKQLGQLARNNQFLFRLCLEDADQVSQLVSNDRDQGMGRIHASLLMASVTPITSRPATEAR